MALENRFEQYDISIDRPAPLVPRYLRWPVTERMNYAGRVLVPLDEDSVRALLPRFEQHAIEAVAVGLLHAYANPAHEKSRRRDSPGCPAGPPRHALERGVPRDPGVRAPVHGLCQRLRAAADVGVSGAPRRGAPRSRIRLPAASHDLGGGLTTLEIAARFPIRLVESGPAGGAILAAEIARECDCGSALSFDMGGTTAKLALIDAFQPQTTRTFEVARAYRNLKGSGLPVRVPAIEMVEIGAGGGSIADVDAMGRLNVGPASAGANPGPACYDRGGMRPTVTDADVVLGRIDPEDFAGVRCRWPRIVRPGRSGTPWGGRWSSPTRRRRWPFPRSWTRTWRTPRASTPSNGGRTFPPER